MFNDLRFRKPARSFSVFDRTRRRLNRDTEEGGWFGDAGALSEVSDHTFQQKESPCRLNASANINMNASKVLRPKKPCILKTLFSRVAAIAASGRLGSGQ